MIETDCAIPQEVTKFAELLQLRNLLFSDPHWGDCPVACLCNYQTYILVTLPNLSSLDTLLLAEETKQLAEATYIKKKMYYNMRIKTMRRNTKNMIRAASRGKEVREHGDPTLGSSQQISVGNKTSSCSVHTNKVMEKLQAFQSCKVLGPSSKKENNWEFEL